MIRVEVTRFFVGRDGHEAAISRAYSGPEDQGNEMVRLGIEECHKASLTLPFADIREMTEEEVAEYQDNEACVEEEKRQRIAAAEAYFRDPNRGFSIGVSHSEDATFTEAGDPHVEKLIDSLTPAQADELMSDINARRGVEDGDLEKALPKLTEAELVKALQEDLVDDEHDNGTQND